MFVLLALVFAGGFIFFGVGSGVGGSGNGSLGDLFNNLFKGGSSGPSISSAQKKVAKSPRSAQAWRALATAYEQKSNHTDDAVNALTTYVSLAPKDGKALAELGSLQRTKADALAQDASLAQVRQQEAYANQTFGPPVTSALGKALGQDPVLQAVQTQVSSESNAVGSQAVAAYTAAVGTYQKLAKLRPDDASVQLDLATVSEAARNTPVEIAALKKAAKLLPDQAAQIRQKIKTLQPTRSG